MIFFLKHVKKMQNNHIFDQTTTKMQINVMYKSNITTDSVYAQFFHKN